MSRNSRNDCYNSSIVMPATDVNGPRQDGAVLRGQSSLTCEHETYIPMSGLSRSGAPARALCDNIMYI